MKRKSSYIGELSSGYKSDTVVEYDPALEEGQIGKERNDKVTEENNWEDDKRIPGIGIGVLSFKEAALKLRRIARRLATMELDYNEQYGIKEKVATSINIAADKDLSKIAEKIQAIGSELASLSVKAQLNHPSEPSAEPWLEESSPQTGDEEWIDIGPGTFDDARNEVGKPLPQTY